MTIIDKIGKRQQTNAQKHHPLSQNDFRESALEENLREGSAEAAVRRLENKTKLKILKLYRPEPPHRSPWVFSGSLNVRQQFRRTNLSAISRHFMSTRSIRFTTKSRQILKMYLFYSS